MKEGKKVFAIAVASLMICLNSLHVVCTKILNIDILEVTSDSATQTDIDRDVARQ